MIIQPSRISHSVPLIPRPTPAHTCQIVSSNYVSEVPLFLDKTYIFINQLNRVGIVYDESDLHNVRRSFLFHAAQSGL